MVLPTASVTWCYLQRVGHGVTDRVGHGVTYSECDMVLPTEWDMVLPTASGTWCYLQRV